VPEPRGVNKIPGAVNDLSLRRLPAGWRRRLGRASQPEAVML
jgi:hypothetical protein